MPMTPISVKSITVKGYSLLKIRLWCYSLAFLHLLLTAFVTLSIDVTVDEDPKVRAYSRLRWYLLTCWFNMISIIYIPICIYCDWCEMFKEDTIRLKKLMQIRDIIMTAILFPVTVYSDISFWVLFKSYPDIMASPRVFQYMPGWAQHSLHTVSLGFVFMDLVLTPRQRPNSYKPGLAILNGFFNVYTIAVYVSYNRGDVVYSYLETSSRTICISSYFASLFLMTAAYYGQWYIINYVWPRKVVTINKEIKLK